MSHFSLPRLCQCVDLPPFRLCGPSAFPILGHQPNEPHGFLEEKGGCGDGAPPDCDVARPYSDPDCGKRGGFNTPPRTPPKKGIDADEEIAAPYYKVCLLFKEIRTREALRYCARKGKMYAINPTPISLHVASLFTLVPGDSRKKQNTDIARFFWVKRGDWEIGWRLFSSETNQEDTWPTEPLPASTRTMEIQTEYTPLPFSFSSSQVPSLTWPNGGNQRGGKGWWPAWPATPGTSHKRITREQPKGKKNAGARPHEARDGSGILSLFCLFPQPGFAACCLLAAAATAGPPAPLASRYDPPSFPTISAGEHGW